MLDGSEWSVLGILPNIKPSTDLEIIAGEFGIFSAESSRVGISEPELRSDWEWVLTHFQDGYGSPYFPAVTCQRTENVACGLDGIKYRDFRNAVCISCLFLVRTQRAAARTRSADRVNTNVRRPYEHSRGLLDVILP